MKNVFTIASLVLTLVFITPTAAQEFGGLDKSPADIASYPASGRDANKKVRVVYSRPQLKGRALSDLAPAGKVWRTGANESTEITFYEDVKVGDQDIEAGSYSLFTVPGQNEWTIILNSGLNQWGSYSYDEGADVARIQAKATEGGEALEAFSIAFKEKENGADMVMGWGSTRVSVPITFSM